MEYKTGTGATLAGDSLEDLFYLLVKWAQQQESSPQANPLRLNYISSNTDDDGRTFRATITALPVNLSMAGITATDYLNGVQYTNGTEGDYSGKSWIDTIISILIDFHTESLAFEEITNFSYTINSAEVGGSGNCTLDAEVTLSKEIVIESSGGKTVSRENILTVFP